VNAEPPQGDATYHSLFRSVAPHASFRGEQHDGGTVSSYMLGSHGWIPFSTSRAERGILTGGKVARSPALQGRGVVSYWIPRKACRLLCKAREAVAPQVNGDRRSAWVLVSQLEKDPITC
jgi:hypothetical protein